MEDRIKISVIDREGQRHEILAVVGANLRTTLIENGLSPYIGSFNKLNCKGLGVCGTCKILVHDNDALWERRSCQIQCFHEMEIRLK